jgi:hypothetical protein
LSASVLIGYKDYGTGSNHPTGAQKAAVLAGANLARKIISKANDEFAAVVMLRRKESPLFQQVCDAHFGLIAGGTSGADSYAWAAVSLYCGALKMGTTADYPGHWMQCQKP